MRLDEDWDQICERFGEFDHTEVSDDHIEYRLDGMTFFRLFRDGELESSMPLHSNSAEDIEEVFFDGSEVTVSSDNFEYSYSLR